MDTDENSWCASNRDPIGAPSSDLQSEVHYPHSANAWEPGLTVYRTKKKKEKNMSHFDERSGVVYCRTPWGQWGQTMEEVTVEVQVPEGTKTRDLRCDIKPRSISIIVNKEDVVRGYLFGTVLVDECVWTLEDKKLVRMVLVKSDRSAGSCWRSLLVDKYEADPWVLDQMEKKLTLERFQRENPGFDFSGAEISGNYKGGGPQF